MTPNAQLAGETLGHLVAVGVKEFVVCAGARNAPLVTSLLGVAEENGLRVFHHFDERCAAFFALGLSKAQRRPTAVLTTSGTAVSELHSAIIEAYYSGVPLIAVTADRPLSFRGSGAPQAIEQSGIFGPYAPIALDVQDDSDLSRVAEWNRTEPLHINVCLDEPTEKCRADELPEIKLPERSQNNSGDVAKGIEHFVAQRSNLAVILGELPEHWRKNVERFLQNMAVPVWAEATSGLRESTRLSACLVPAEKNLGNMEIDKVLRIGGVPSLRFWRDLESQLETEVLSVTPRPFSGLARDSRILVTSAFPALCDEEEGETPPMLRVEGDLDSILTKHQKSEPGMLRTLSEWIPESARIFLGNSLPIREWNLAASREVPHPDCHANRGANGIDGEIATFLGMSDHVEECWGIFGDLTTLYDLNAPALLGQLRKGRRRIVILNNGGGKIFSRLPSMAALSGSEKSITENHHETRFRSWAEMWGMEYVTWTAGDEPPKLVQDTAVIEMQLDNEASEAFWREWR